MVGEGVLHECLQHDAIDEVLVVNKRPCGITHSKLKELVHNDFYDLILIADQLNVYDACLFCLGVSSIGMKESEFYKPTYTLTMHFANTVSHQNSNITFCYISGAGTDSIEKGKLMWARVKGKTENDLMKLPFKKVYNFRPGYMQATRGLKNTLSFYKYMSWLYPALRAVFPKNVSTLKESGLTMINALTKGYNNRSSK
ncbi:epimerase [soil metagenome]